VSFLEPTKTKNLSIKPPLLIRTFMQDFRCTKSTLLYRVKKPNDSSKSREVISTSDLKRYRSFITSTAPIVIENPAMNRRNMSLFEFLHPKVFNCGKNSFVERTKPLRNFSKGSGTGCTNKS